MSKTETSKIETVKVTLELPKQIIKWFDDGDQPLKKRLEYELVQECWNQMESADHRILVEKFGASHIFEKYDIR